VVECKGIGATLTYTRALQKLGLHLKTLHTAPPIALAIITRLRQWRKYGDNHLPPFRNHDLYGSHHAADDQDKIGWYIFLLGRLFKKWSDSQQRYIYSLHRKNSGRRWVSSVIQKARDIAWDIWEQRNDINQNTMHPWRAAEVVGIKAQLRVLYRGGSDSLLPIDHHLFSKLEATLQLGEPNLMLQWITSVLTAYRRAAVATKNIKQTMTAERALMQSGSHDHLLQTRASLGPTINNHITYSYHLSTYINKSHGQSYPQLIKLFQAPTTVAGKPSSLRSRKIRNFQSTSGKSKVFRGSH
jgi:hypothetical protein